MNGLPPKDVPSGSSGGHPERSSGPATSSYGYHRHHSSTDYESASCSTTSSSPFSSCSSSFLPSPSGLPLEIEPEPLITSAVATKHDLSIPLSYGGYSPASSLPFLHSPYSTATTISSSASSVSRQSAAPDSPLTHHHPPSSTSSSPSPSSFEGFSHFTMMHDARPMMAISGAASSLPSSVSTGTATALARSLLPEQHHPQSVQRVQNQFHVGMLSAGSHHATMSHMDNRSGHNVAASAGTQQSHCACHHQQHHSATSAGGQEEQLFCLDSQCLAAYTSSLIGWDGQYVGGSFS
jgi:hypothetical protein